MIIYKQLTADQVLVLSYMRDFECKNILCSDCPLYNPTAKIRCGSVRADSIVDKYYEEHKL